MPSQSQAPSQNQRALARAIIFNRDAMRAGTWHPVSLCTSDGLAGLAEKLKGQGRLRDAADHYRAASILEKNGPISSIYFKCFRNCLREYVEMMVRGLVERGKHVAAVKYLRQLEDMEEDDGAKQGWRAIAIGCAENAIKELSPKAVRLRIKRDFFGAARIHEQLAFVSSRGETREDHLRQAYHLVYMGLMQKAVGLDAEGNHEAAAWAFVKAASVAESAPARLSLISRAGACYAKAGNAWGGMIVTKAAGLIDGDVAMEVGDAFVSEMDAEARSALAKKEHRRAAECCLAASIICSKWDPDRSRELFASAIGSYAMATGSANGGDALLLARILDAAKSMGIDLDPAFSERKAGGN